MKLARYRKDGQTAIGLVEGDAVTRLSGRIDGIGEDMIALITQWDALRARIEGVAGGRDVGLPDVELLAPISRPGKIWGIGLNYADHVAEAAMETPSHQSWFVMAQTTVAGPFQPIERPRASGALDYEAEMVFVIGKGGRHISEEDAPNHIFGYCVGNDVSVRDFQFHSGQFSIGKSFDTHAPFGPWIVTPDEIDAKNLPIRSFVNGEKRQESNTRHLIYDPAKQIAYLSQAMTLEPGDVFFTGTPGGVGAAMKPPQFLAPGDRVRVEIDGIGFIENIVVEEAA
ncbi:fumarylacetoacetate hydrolase family protein [Sphingobium chlorophenolicum]|uniref:Ureidoglycolate lyase n=1 Tax=Sphingobium chlorophenolicum TaxID=46429 RepID=A0A081RA03_SPHCR|nr:fumarylacetoacetate hydrolase family protein [Sphingobium chlorophenolicum]KEQ52026.1 Ureidoglycolate lyase [Sphingobium chlorophenolicum]